MQSLLLLISLLLWKATFGSYRTALGDPEMIEVHPRVMLEGWNMCNRCGNNCTTAPRWADCVSSNGPGPNGNRVTATDNESGLPAARNNQSACDSFTEAKERNLGKLCEVVGSGRGNTSYFWTGMLKSGNYKTSKNCILCGLWCKNNHPNCCRKELGFNNLPMNQPRVSHEWSKKDSNGNWHGLFEGSWDLEHTENPSYFGLQWFVRNGTRVFRNSLRTSKRYPWLMLYTGVDAAIGRKGGYPWDGRGMMTVWPYSTYNNLNKTIANDFQVKFWLNISSWQTDSSFYFLNMAACWKMNGEECDGNITSDVTRYILLDISKKKKGSTCSVEQQHLCPVAHVLSSGEVVYPNNTEKFPYDAYHAVGGFDPYSNPQQQDFIKLAPSPEWAQYGFPESTEAALTPKHWTLNPGQCTSKVKMEGTEPPHGRKWTTFNIGPEMGLGGAKPVLAVWEFSKFDVLVRDD